MGYRITIRYTMKMKIFLLLIPFFGIQVALGQCPVTITPSSSTSICYGNSLTLVADGVDGDWSWSPALGLDTINGNTVVASPVNTTTYTVTRTCLTGSSTATITITVNPLPISNAGANISFCSGGSGTLGAALAAGNTYSWSPTAGLSNPLISNPSVTLTNPSSLPTNSAYVLTTTNTLTGCSSTDTVQVTVNPIPVPNFTFPTNQCSSTAVPFTNTSVAGVSYQWAFGDPTSGANNTSILMHATHTFASAVGTATEVFPVTLIASANGCSDTTIQNITILEGPDGSLDDYNSAIPFTFCSGGPFDLEITNSSLTAATNTSYTINWGDGTPNFTSTNWPLNATQNHIYATLGYFTLELSVTGPNGCVTTTPYVIYNGGNPAVGLGSPGNTVSICAPSTLTFPITGTAGNPPGTIYILSTNTGMPPVTFTHPPPASYTHTFTTSSCNATGANTPNAFYVRIRAENPCGFSESTVEPITTSIAPVSQITIAPDSIACINTTVNFSNTSINGASVNAFGVCSVVTKSNWTITPASGWNVVSGSMGSPTPTNNPATWGSTNLGVQFTAPGIYNVSMITGNACGEDTMSRLICIQEPPVPAFTLDTTIACNPLAVSATNTSSSLVGCAPSTYVWSVNYAPTNCGTGAGWSFTNGTNASSVNPSFLFTNPGTYTVTLSVTNHCGTFTTSQDVVIKSPPLVNLNTTPTSSCVSPGSTVPVVTATNCATSPLTYAWSFPGGSPATSTVQNPGSITYSAIGVNIITVAVSNECGTTTANASFTINPNPITSAGSNTSICAGASTVLNGSATGGAGPYTYAWTSIPAGFSSSLQNPTVSPSVTTTYLLTVTNATLCSDTAQMIVVVNPLPSITVNSTSSCAGIATTLNASGADTYTWTPSSSLSAPTGASVNASPTVTTLYTVTGTNTATGCFNSAISTVTVNPLPIVNAGPDIMLCNQPFPNTLTGFSPTSGGTGVWSGAGVTSAGVFTPSGVGSVPLTYTFTNSNGCVASDAISVNVVNPQTADAGPSFTLCANAPSTPLTGFTPAGGIWSGAGISGNSFNPSVAGVGTHILTYTFGSGTCLSTDTLLAVVNPLATVNANVGQTVCVGGTITLAGSIGGSATSATWSAPSGTFSDPTSLTSTYTPSITSGTVTLTLTSNDPAGPCGSVSSTMVVTVNPLATANAGAAQTVCVGGTINLAGTIGGSATSATWSAPSGTFSNSTSLTSTYTPSILSGTVTLTLTTNDPAGPCSAVTSTMVVTVNPAATANANVGQTICAGGTITLNGSIGGSATSATWSAPSGTFSDPTSLTSTYTPSISGGTVTLTLTTNDPAGPCPAATSTMIVTVNPLPIVNAGPDIMLCNQPVPNTLTGFSPTSGGTGVWSGVGVTSAGIFTPNGVGSVMLTYSFTNSNGCFAADSVLVNVVDPMNAIAGPSFEVCIDAPAAPMTGYSPLGGLWSGAGISGNTFDASVAGVGTHILTLSYGSGTCLSTDTLLATVYPVATANANVGQTICAGGTVTLAGSIGGSATSGTWSAPSGTFSNASSLTSTYTPSITSGTVTLTLTTNDPAGPCSPVTSTMIVTVNPVATATAGAAQSVCVGGTINLTGIIGGSATSATWSAPSGTFSNATSLTSTYTPSITNGTVTLTLTTNDPVGPCSPVTSTMIVTVNPVATANANVGQTICAGGTIALNGSIAGSATSATWSAPSGTFSDPTSLTSTYTPSISGGTVTLTLTTNDPAGPCPAATSTMIVTVNPLPIVDAGPNQVLCNQPDPYAFSGSPVGGTWSGSLNITNAGVFTPNGIETSTLYYFYTNPTTGCQNTDSTLVTVAPTFVPTILPTYSVCIDNPGLDLNAVLFPSIAGGTWTGNGVSASTFTPATVGAGNHVITYTVGTGACFASTTANITVMALPIIAANNPSTCVGQSASLTASGAGVGGVYQWTASPTLSCLICVTTSANTPTTTAYTVTGTTSLGCTGSTTAIVTINPLPTVDAGPEISLCNQPNPYQFVGSPAGGTWFGSPNISSSGVFIPNGLETTTLYYSVIDQTTGCQNMDSTVVNVLTSIIPTVTPTYSICVNGSSVDLNSVLNPSPLGGDWSGPGVINPTFVPSIAGPGVHLVSYSIGTGTCAASVTSEITVNPTPTVNPISPLTICNNASFNVNLGSSVTSTFVWQAQPSANVTGEMTLPQTSGTVSNTLTNLTGTVQNVQYTVTPTSIPQGCAGTSSNFIISVLPDVLISSPTSTEICSGSAVNAPLSANLPSTFTWFTTFDNPNVTGESITTNSGPMINDVLTNTTSSNQIVVYSVTPTSINGSCPGAAQTVTVLVKPPLELLNDDTLTICSGSNVDLTLEANTAVTFNWFALPTINVQGESITTSSGATINDVLVNTTSNPQEVIYNVIGTSSSNGCSSPIFPIHVFVNPIPSMTDPMDQVVCNGTGSQPINFVSTVNNSTFTWTNSIASIGLSASGTGSIPSFNAVNNSNAPIVSTITVDVHYANGGLVCAGNTESFTITVNPTPTFVPIPDQQLCNGNMVNAINFVGNISGAEYTWTNSIPTIGIGASGTGNIASFTGNNPTTATQIATINVAATYTNAGLTCSGQTQDFTIRIYPAATLVNTGATICSNEAISLPLTASLPTIITWQATNNVNIAGETVQATTSAIILDSLINIGNAQETVNYQVTLNTTEFGCITGPYTVPVVVNPLPAVDFSMLNTAFCTMSDVNFQNLSSGQTTYLWTFGDGTYSNVTNPSHTYENAGAYSVELTGTDSNTGCVNTETKLLTVSAIPEVDFDVSSPSGCVTMTAVFSDVINAPNSELLWDFGDGTTSNQTNSIDHQYSETGCYDVTLTVTNEAGCVASFTELDFVCVYPRPEAAFDLSVDSAHVNNPEFEFFNQSINAETYSWILGMDQRVWRLIQRMCIHLRKESITFGYMRIAKADVTTA